MNDLSRPWPLGLDGRRWWMAVPLALVVTLAVALGIDRMVSVWAQGWPDPVLGPLGDITRLWRIGLDPDPGGACCSW